MAVALPKLDPGIEAEIRRIQKTSFAPPASIDQVAALSRRRMGALAAGGADARDLRELFRDSLRELDSRYSSIRKYRTFEGETNPRRAFSYVQNQAVRAQLEQAIHSLTDRINDWHSAAVRRYAVKGVSDTIREVKGLEQFYRGVGAPLSVEQAAVFAGLVKDTEASILRTNPNSSIQAYGMRLIEEWEGQLARSVLAKTPYLEVIDRITAAARKPGLLAGDNYGYPTFERWQAERIVRTELAGAYNGAKFRTLQTLRGRDFGGDMQKLALATFDDRTALDSYPVNEQVRGLDEPFEDGAGRRYLYPPGRPNDREVVLPWRAAWGVKPGQIDDVVEEVAPPRPKAPRKAKPKPAPVVPPPPPVPVAPPAPPAPVAPPGPALLSGSEIRDYFDQLYASGKVGAPDRWNDGYLYDLVRDAAPGQETLAGWGVTREDLDRNWVGLSKILTQSSNSRYLLELKAQVRNEIETDRLNLALFKADRKRKKSDYLAKPSDILAAVSKNGAGDSQITEGLLSSKTTLGELAAARPRLLEVYHAETEAKKGLKRARADEARHAKHPMTIGALHVEEAERLADVVRGWERLVYESDMGRFRRSASRAEIILDRATTALDAKGLTDKLIDEDGLYHLPGDKLRERFQGALFEGRQWTPAMEAVLNNWERGMEQGKAGFRAAAGPGWTTKLWTPGRMGAGKYIPGYHTDADLDTYMAATMDAKREAMRRTLVSIGPKQWAESKAKQWETINWELFYDPKNSQYTRAHAVDLYNKIRLGPTSSPATIAHEFGHHIEYRAPKDDREVLFAWSRMQAIRQKRELKWLGAGYEKDERAYAGLFPDEYTSKDYGGTTSELWSMLTQGMVGDADSGDTVDWLRHHSSDPHTRMNGRNAVRIYFGLLRGL